MSHSQPLTLDIVDRYLPESLRAFVEQNYYAKVNQQAVLDRLARNEAFMQDPLAHVAVYSDHGVVHVRDVARNIIDVLDTVNGVLIPLRPQQTLDFMKGYGVMLAYNHDIGMMDFSAFGRTMHPEFAAQAVFAPAYDEFVDTVWSENWGNVAWRLVNLHEVGALTGDPKITLRELLAMSIGHSKSKTPVAVLNDPQRLRQVMLTATATELHHLYHDQQVAKARARLEQARAVGKETNGLGEKLRRAEEARAAFVAQNPDRENTLVTGRYDDFRRDAFRWLTSARPELQALVADVVDTLRALRVADALRQRGTTLKTSGGYQVFIDQNTANAVIALQKGSGEVLMLNSDDPYSVGEANIASSEITPEGDLRISFHRGAFLNDEDTTFAAQCCALIVDDIQRDTIGSFRRASQPNGDFKSSDDIAILIEETDDNLAFADMIQAELANINPEIARRSRIVPSLKHVSSLERERYLAAESLAYDDERQRQVLTLMHQAGHKTGRIDPGVAFTDVRLTHLREGDVLIEAGAPPAFIYVPTGSGLVSLPEGGYQPQNVPPWVPLGNTRVIRGDIQEATVSARQDIRLIIIPKEIYLKYWHDTYSVDEFTDALKRLYAQEEQQGLDFILGILEQIAMLDGQLADSEVEFIQAFLQSMNQSMSAEAIRNKLLSGERPDYTTLRRATLDYLTLNPSVLQVSRLIDLVNLLANVDEEVSPEEALILSELNSLLESYLNTEASRPLYSVLIVPQNPEQDHALGTLFPNMTRVERSYGHAYHCGSFNSADYANMIRERYRALQFFAVVEREDSDA